MFRFQELLCLISSFSKVIIYSNRTANSLHTTTARHMKVHLSVRAYSDGRLIESRYQRKVLIVDETLAFTEGYAVKCTNDKFQYIGVVLA